MSIPEAETITQITIAALGGGTFYKVVDSVMRRRATNAKAESVLSDAAMEQVRHMSQEVKRATDMAERFMRDFDECRRNYEETRVVVADLKITLRNLYDFMQEHIETCPSARGAKIPTVPPSLLE